MQNTHQSSHSDFRDNSTVESTFFNTIILYRFFLALFTFILYWYAVSPEFVPTELLVVFSVYLISNVAFSFLLKSKKLEIVIIALPLTEAVFSLFTFFITGGMQSPFLLVHFSVLLLSSFSSKSFPPVSFFAALLFSVFYTIAGITIPRAPLLVFPFFGYAILLPATLVTSLYLSRMLSQSRKEHLSRLTAIQDTLFIYCHQLLSCKSLEEVLRLLMETTHYRCISLGVVRSDDNDFSSSHLLCNGTFENNFTINLPLSMVTSLTETVRTPVDLSSSMTVFKDPILNLTSVSFCTACSFRVEGSPDTHVLFLFNDSSFHSEDITDVLISKTTLFLGMLIGDMHKESEGNNKRFFKHTRNKMVSTSHMAGRIAHDFNNVIGAVGGYSSLLKKKLGEDHPNIRYVNNIISASATGSDLTNQLSLLVKNTQTLRDSIDIHAVLSTVLTLLRDDNERRVILSSSFDARRHHVLGDKTLLKNVLLHIGRNAIQACQENQGTILFATSDYHIEQDSRLCESFPIKPGDAILVTIKDNGTGIPEEFLDRVFDPYFSTRQKGMGNGLGLSYLWTYLETYRGALELNTKPDEGTTIKLYFSTTGIDIDHSEITETSERSRSISSILIVDDEPSIRDIYTEILSDLDYEVFSVCDGSEVIPFMEESGHSIDLVLLDMVMPKMNGMETFKALRARYKDIPVLFMSGLATSASLSSLLEEPSTAFYDKSKDYSHLISIIKDYF